MRTLFREPLVHFLVVAGMLFGLNSFWSDRRKPLVEITAAAVQAQARLSEQRLRRPLSAADTDRLTQEMLQEEILFQEAQRRGMVADNQVRGTLIAMMRTALKPVTAVPDDSILLALRDELPRETTTLPEQLSFEHVSFSAPDKVPADLLAKLRSGGASPSLGETIRLANPLPLTYRPQLESLLGADCVTQLVKLPVNEWHGPLTSTRGIHFVRLIARVAEQTLPMEQLRPLLESHWLKSHEADVITSEVARLKNNYRIILPVRGSVTEASK
jgi:hypothetical protein